MQTELVKVNVMYNGLYMMYVLYSTLYRLCVLFCFFYSFLFSVWSFYMTSSGVNSALCMSMCIRSLCMLMQVHNYIQYVLYTAVCTTLCVYVLQHQYTAGCCLEIVPPSLSYPGSYVHVMDAAPFLHHSQPMDGHMTSDPMSPPPEGEGLRTSLVSQLEYYFSKENLSSDKYLCEYHL